MFRRRRGDASDPPGDDHMRVTDGVDEAQMVFSLRMLRLLEAGFPEWMAERLADRSDVDLHEAEDLVKRVLAKGLDARIAYRILS